MATKRAAPHPEHCEHPPAPRLRARASVDAATVDRAAAIFRALGDSGRLALLARLSEAELCVSDLAGESNEGLSTVSQRLRMLRADGVVTRRREGKHIFYTLADTHVAELIQNALEHAAHLTVPSTPLAAPKRRRTA
jgi:ArsR family transcriptional regulator, lead/cadmium/zinc/bismuth-responsive transcriptional repressor